MSHRPVYLLIEDMWESIEKIERFVLGFDREAFRRDDKTVDSVVRNLEIIGEAANRLPEDFKSIHSKIAWSRIVGLRNRIIHDYFGIDLEIIWEILTKGAARFQGKTFRNPTRTQEQ